VIALDTNVLVRFLVQDDPAQGRTAATLIGGLTAEAPGWICREVAVEMVWVLERAYRLTRAEIADAVEALLEARELRFEAEDRVGLAINRYRKGGPGFSDQMILIAAGQAGCSGLFSFDRRLVQAGAVAVDGA
jgi:predicted nucleic-acid-binding protein